MTKILKITTCITLIFCSAIIIAISGAYLHLSPSLPDAAVIDEIKLQIPLRIYSYDGQLIGEFGDKRRKPIDRKDVPETFIQAFLAAEDAKFYSHIGISFKSLGRAVWQRLTRSNKQTGGSTITMQVAKNYFLSSEKTIIRKVREIFLSLQIERALSKDQILELYVNKIFLGNRAYGIAAAAQVYYGETCAELSLAQVAMIAGLPKAPSTYNPIINPERAIKRRNWILKRMKKLGYISEDAYTIARAEPITAKKHQVDIDINAPYIAEMARSKAVALYGSSAYTEGYRVITTINSKLQQTAQKAVKNGLHAYDSRHGFRPVEAHINELSAESKSAFFAKSKPIASRYPAVIIELQPNSVKAELADGTVIDILWDNGLATAQPYISASRKGKAPKKASDILTTGDVIRVHQIEELWHMTQLPNAEAALVTLNPYNGAVLALVGGYDFNKSKFNRATQAQRQIGSNIKPFIYSTALANGFTPATTINDAPVVFDDNQLEGTWRPENDGGKFYGPTRLRKALYKSRNLVSVRILRKLGLNKTIEFISQFGFDKSKLPKDLSLALGSPIYTPIDVATAYASFANRGFKISPYLISEIQHRNGDIAYKADPALACDPCNPLPQETTSNGNKTEPDTIIEEAASLEDLTNEIEENETEESEQVIKQAPRIISEQVVFLIDDILHDVIGPGGTARRAMSLNRSDLAGKTGTTNGPTDAWFSGYHPNIVTTVWLGFNNNAVLGRGEYGGSAALPIWIEFMQEALKNEPEITHRPPPGIISVLIDKNTGKRAKPGQENTMFEFIQEELIPTIETSGEESQENIINTIEGIF